MRLQGDCRKGSHHIPGILQDGKELVDMYVAHEGIPEDTGSGQPQHLRVAPPRQQPPAPAHLARARDRQTALQQVLSEGSEAKELRLELSLMRSELKTSSSELTRADATVRSALLAHSSLANLLSCHTVCTQEPEGRAAQAQRSSWRA